MGLSWVCRRAALQVAEDESAEYAEYMREKALQEQLGTSIIEGDTFTLPDGRTIPIIHSPGAQRYLDLKKKYG